MFSRGKTDVFPGEKKWKYGKIMKLKLEKWKNEKRRKRMKNQISDPMFSKEKTDVFPEEKNEKSKN